MELAIDHVILTVRDIEVAAARLESSSGLATVAGGRHAGHGTGNRLVPLGSDYLELMGVVDEAEAEGSPLGRWVMGRTACGDGPAAVCLRTHSLDTICEGLGLDAIPMTRRRPDGFVLSWRLAGLEAALGPEALPFFIEWDGPPEEHPARAEAGHQTSPHGIAWVEIGGDAGRLRSWLETDGLPIVPVGGVPGIRRVGLATGRGEVIL